GPDCGDMLFRKIVEEAMWMCPACQYHFRISARQRIDQLVDPGSFEEMFDDIDPADPLKFVDKKAYKDRLKAEQLKTGNRDAVICGKAFIKGRPMMMAVMDPTFMMGSMGSVVGEKITRTIEAARSEEHTSELQSLRHLVCRLLLEKKKQKPSAARSHRL